MSVDKEFERLVFTRQRLINEGLALPKEDDLIMMVLIQLTEADITYTQALNKIKAIHKYGQAAKN